MMREVLRAKQLSRKTISRHSTCNPEAVKPYTEILEPSRQNYQGHDK